MARITRTPWSFRPGTSLLHRAPAALKLLGLAALTAAVFAFGAPALAGAAFLIALLSMLAGIKPWELLRGGRALIIMVVIIIVFRSLRFDFPLFDGSFHTESNILTGIFDPDGAREALIFGGGILVSFTAGALLFSVTTMGEIKDSIDALETGLFRLKRPRFGLALALMLGFIPRFFEVWEAAALAWKARAGKRGLRSLAVLIPLVTECMMQRAADTAAALEARGLEL